MKDKELFSQILVGEASILCQPSPNQGEDWLKLSPNELHKYRHHKFDSIVVNYDISPDIIDNDLEPMLSENGKIALSHWNSKEHSNV